MLSPANMFLLGVIDAAPINPYEIVSRFEFHRYKSLLRLADSTIYAYIRALHRKGFIQFELQQEGAMPAKKVYRLTEAGQVELKDSIRSYLSGNSSDGAGFSDALLLMHYFSREELISFLETHQAVLEPEVVQRLDDYNFVGQIHCEYSCIPNVISAYQVYMQVKAELNTTCYAIQMLREAQEWPQNTFERTQVYKDRYLQREQE